MGYKRTWEQHQQAAGQAVGSFIHQSQQAIGKSMCRLYRRYPRSFPLAPYVQSFIAPLCSDFDEPLQTYDPPQFTGGQCSGVQYFMWGYGLKSLNTGGGEGTPFFRDPPELLRQSSVIYTGAVTKYEIIAPGEQVITLEDFKLNARDYGIPLRLDVYHADGLAVHSIPLGITTGFEPIEFRRIDGEADNCGDLDLDLPPDPPHDPLDFNKTIRIFNYNESGDVLDYRDFNLVLGDEINNNFNGTVNFGGANIYVNLDGIDVGGEPPLSKSDLPPSVPPNTPAPAPGDEGQIEEEPAPESDPVEELEEEKDGLLWVLVTVTQLPSKGKIIVKKNEEDNDMFAGYLSWIFTKKGRYTYITEPIRKRKSAFKAPGTVNGYRIHAINGARLAVKTYTEEIEED